MRERTLLWRLFLAALVIVGAGLVSGCGLAKYVDWYPDGKVVCEKGQHWCSEHGGGCVPDGTACGPYVPPAKPTSCKPNPCPADKPRCRETIVHGNRSGDPSTWTEGVMVECLRPAPVEPDTQGCLLAGQPSTPLPGYAMEHGETVSQAIREITGQDGGRIVVAQGRQAFQAAVIQALRAKGLCAGQHAPDSDEIAVATAWDAKRSTPWEAYHVYAGPEAGPGTAVLYPQAGRDAWMPPVPPRPVKPPVESACGEPVPPPLGKIKLECRPGRDGVTVCDSTPLVYSPGGTYCASVGSFNDDGITGRLFCSPRPEGHPQRLACEQLILGAPAPVFVWSGPASQFNMRANPFAAEFTTGAGTLVACNADHSICSEAH
jgi:hypothetical protein